jgi:alpha-aminoadipate carrier protein LysW
MAMCPECEVLISIPGTLRLGKIVECPECGATLEVVSIEPPELDVVMEEEEEDWEEDLEDLEEEEELEEEDYLWEEEEDLEEDFDDEE